MSGLIHDLASFRPWNEEEARHRDLILKFTKTHDRPFDRAHIEGHLTASAVIVDFEENRVILGYHRKLGRWLQLGGHGEPGETNPESVAMREATEESGIQALRMHPTAPRPFDLDVHLIPEHQGVPAHNHLDIRYVLMAPPGADPQHLADEHHSVRWFSWKEALALNLDESLIRALRKTRNLATSPST